MGSRLAADKGLRHHSIMVKKILSFIPFVVVLSLAVYLFFFKHDTQDIALNSKSPELEQLLASDMYFSKIRPIFNARCVACHSCYNSPCQLDLTSYEGLTRGASKDSMYSFPLLNEKHPTRIGVDEKSIHGWRKRNFFSVIPDPDAKGEKYQTDSMLWALVNMRNKNFEKKDIEWKSEGGQYCANPNKIVRRAGQQTQRELTEMADYMQRYGYKGMPFGLPALDDRQIATLQTWFEKGAPGPSEEVMDALRSPGKLAPLIAEFEDFFNATDFKSRLTARYIYEHLFLAHIYFEEKPGHFFRLVRAINPTGEPDEIATTRPFDDPKVKFYYRLKKYTTTLVFKNHIPYAFSEAKLNTWKQRFLQSQWTRNDQVFPAYGKEGANPFTTFIAIPAEARYRFFLDNAQYHLMNFIKGPVCNGQVAVSVIDDNFWVMFVDPKVDVTVTQPTFFEQNAKLMNVPAEEEVGIDDIRSNYNLVNQNKYAYYKKLFPQGLGLDTIWNGDEVNPNALLTVYRHNDSATVIKGAHGQVPKIIWILDYPLFEDVYYNLVAGYNVFGPIKHQVMTRKHMDHSRVDGEDLFISMLPQNRRMAIRDEWTNKGPENKKLQLDTLLAKVLREKNLDERMNIEKPYFGMELPAKLQFQSKNEKAELLQRIFTSRLNEKVRGPIDSINCCAGQVSAPAKVSSFEDAEKWFSTIAGSAQKFAVAFPDAAYVRVTTDDGKSKAYTLIHNKEHYNVSYLFMEDTRRDYAKDSLNFVAGYAAAYPNMYFDVRASDVPKFVQSLAALTADKASWNKLTASFGVLRSSPKFWAFHDWLNQNIRQVEPIEGAQLDLNRYMSDH